MRRRSLLRSVVAAVAAACGVQGTREEPSSSIGLGRAATTITPRVTSTITPTTAPATRPPNPFGVVDATTLERKLLFGYQNFYHAPGDGSAFANSWSQWSARQDRAPSAETIKIDNWPDTSELEPDELFPTELRYGDGRVAALYSSFKRKTTIRHFRWMGEHGLDGVLLQRFPTSPWDPREFAFRETVTRSVREGCETYGRVFAIEYDIGSMGHGPAGEGAIAAELKEDWQYQVDVLRVLESDRYLRHQGRPVLGLYGFGLPGRPGSVTQAREVISWFARDAPERYRVTLVGGVMPDWRTSPGPKGDPAWLDIYRSYDVIQPWHPSAAWPPGSIARTDDDVREVRRHFVEPDVAEARKIARSYMPVVYPGISWSNRARAEAATLPQHQPPGPLDELNAVPRRAGRFWWRQLYEYVSAGCVMVKCAMFDEVAEGTAMYKVAAAAKDAPLAPRMVTLDQEGTALPSDWYLRLASAGTKMLRGEIPLVPDPPIRPG